MSTADILIRHATLRRDQSKQVDIAIRDGKIAAVEPSLSVEAETEIDAAGRLVTESFANPHLHLCKVYTLDRMDDLAMSAYHGEGMGKAMSAIELAARVKADYDETWIIENVRRALNEAIRFGNTHIRAFADVDNQARLEGVRALLKAREAFRGVVDVQVVAFAQDGIIRETGAESLVREAMALGADVVGGIP